MSHTTKHYGARYSQDQILHPYVDMIGLVHQLNACRI